MDEPSLEDLIYECAFVPEMWPDVLDRLARIVDARGGAFVAGEGKVLTHWTVSTNLQELVDAMFADDSINRTRRRDAVLGARHAGFMRDTQGLTDDDLGRDDLYRKHLWPAGLGYAAGTALQMPTGEAMIISMERERAKGPIEKAAIQRLDVLRPHLARSVYLAARQQLAQARNTASVLAKVGLPAIVMTDTGQVLVANDLVDDLKAHVIWRAAGRIALADRNADATLHHAIAAIHADDSAPLRSFVVRGADATAALIAHVLPLRGSARDIFDRCAAVLVLTPVTMPQAPPVELVQSLFDLTPAEARVARSIASGDTVEEIATRGGVSHHTVRSQLRGILSKTGCRRQAEVASLLGGIRPFGE